MSKFRFIALLSLATIAMSCGGSDDEISSGGSPSATYNVTCDPMTINAGSDGVTAEVTVNSDYKDWQIFAKDDGSTSFISAKRTGTTSATVTVAPNTSYDARHGIVVVRAGSTRKEIQVTQIGKVRDTSIQAPDGYTLVWNDEFTGSSLNGDWAYEVQKPGWVNNELQEYVHNDKVVHVSDGTLKITCYKEGDKIYSGRIYAKPSIGWKYGYFEACIKLPKGKGTWPAWWMMPVNNDWNTNPWPDCGEIDIMEEVGYHPNYTSSSIHCKSYNHTIGTQKTHEQLTQNAEGEFHTYACEWTPDFLKFYVDGKLHMTFQNDGANNHATWPFTYAFYPILNLAWGGSWGGAQGVDESVLPVTMEVDYVRIFQKK